MSRGLGDVYKRQVDNEGNVVGVVTFIAKEEQYNVAMSLNAFCAKILTCEEDYYWQRD